MSVGITPAHPAQPVTLRTFVPSLGGGCAVSGAGLCARADAPAGCDLRCAGLEAPARTRQRLAELGLRLGAPIRVLSRTSGRGFVLTVSGARIAVDATTAAGIVVRDASAPTGGSVTASA